MTISKELFLAILSMDSYNRGYNPGIAGLDDCSDGMVRIGNAKPMEGVTAKFAKLVAI